VLTLNIKVSTATIFSESAGATKLGIEQQISNKKALKEYVLFFYLKQFFQWLC